MLNRPYQPYPDEEVLQRRRDEEAPEERAVIARAGRRERDELAERQERNQGEEQDRPDARPVASDTAKTSAITHHARMRALMLSTVPRFASPVTSRLIDPAGGRRDDEQHDDAAHQAEQGRIDGKAHGVALSWIKRVARPGEEVVLVVVRPGGQRAAEHDATEHRHRQDLPLREDPIQVVEIDRDQLDIRTRAGQMVEAALEGAELRRSRRASLRERRSGNAGRPFRRPSAAIEARAHERRRRASAPARSIRTA